MKTIKFCTEEESRFLRFPEPTAARKSHPAKNGTQHSLRPNKAEETVDDPLNPLQTSRTVAGQIHSNPKSHKSGFQRKCAWATIPLLIVFFGFVFLASLTPAKATTIFIDIIIERLVNEAIDEWLESYPKLLDQKVEAAILGEYALQLQYKREEDRQQSFYETTFIPEVHKTTNADVRHPVPGYRDSIPVGDIFWANELKHAKITGYYRRWQVINSRTKYPINGHPRWGRTDKYDGTVHLAKVGAIPTKREADRKVRREYGPGYEAGDAFHKLKETWNHLGIIVFSEVEKNPMTGLHEKLKIEKKYPCSLDYVAYICDYDGDYINKKTFPNGKPLRRIARKDFTMPTLKPFSKCFTDILRENEILGFMKAQGGAKRTVKRTVSHSLCGKSRARHDALEVLECLPGVAAAVHKSCVQKYELSVEQINDDYTDAPLKAYLKDGTGGI